LLHEDSPNVNVARLRARIFQPLEASAPKNSSDWNRCGWAGAKRHGGRLQWLEVTALENSSVWNYE
jgi:hypothetical protein